jgi:hypothetical protein
MINGKTAVSRNMNHYMFKQSLMNYTDIHDKLVYLYKKNIKICQF